MRALLALILVCVIPAHAFQFGTGMAPGMQCPYPYGPGNGSYSGDDQIRNLMGGLANAERKLERSEAKLSELNKKIEAAKAKIKRVIKSSSAMSEIERHYKYRANREDYSQACGRAERSSGGRTASAGSPGANVMNRPSRGGPTGGQEDSGRYAVPSDYCQGGVNDWQHVVADDGMVLDSICDYEVPLSRNRPDESRSADCRDGLEAYYQQMAKKEALENECRDLRKKVEKYNADKERIADQIAEGTYCPFCESQRRGQSNMGTGNFAMMGVAILGALFNRQPQHQQPMLVAVPRRGPPNMLPYGGMPQAPQMMPFPGANAFPGRPYAAPMPGYMGMQPGFGPGQSLYGAMPGSMGPGAFGCQGTSPYSFGNPLAAQFNPFNNSYANPFNNPFANDPFSPYNQMGQNPFGQHPLLNPGYGPGIMPFLGNGLNPNGAPGMLPFPGANNNPYAYNPYAPYGSPFGGQGAPGMLPFPNGGNPYMNNNPYWNNNPYALPYPGGGSPYGGLPYGGSPYAMGGMPYGLGGAGAPGTMPYLGGGSPYATNMPYGGGGVYNSPFAAPYYSNPVQNYGYQMGLLRQGVSQIGGGLYQGGAPGVLPYIGGGTGGGYPPPPPAPRTPVNGAAPGVLPSR